MVNKSTKLIVALCACSALISIPFTSVAQAKECTDGHWHHGNSGSNPYKSKRAAMLAAVDSWRGFTAFEYGVAWAYYNNSADKQSKCEKHPGNRWSCAVDARPCKR